MKRTIGTIVASSAMAMMAPRPALADQTYLRESEAPRVLFPESTGSGQKTLELSDAELHALSRKLERQIELRRYKYLEVSNQAGTLGSIFVLDVIGQSQPITFAVGVAKDGSVRDLQVMVYREPHGEEVREARFRRQFNGKRLSDPLVLGKDIDAISGATISSRSAAYATRKALALAEILHGRTAAAGAK